MPRGTRRRLIRDALRLFFRLRNKSTLVSTRPLRSLSDCDLLINLVLIRAPFRDGPFLIRPHVVNTLWLLWLLWLLWRRAVAQAIGPS